MLNSAIGFSQNLYFDQLVLKWQPNDWITEFLPSQEIWLFCSSLRSEWVCDLPNFL